jgi:hypothetical protein
MNHNTLSSFFRIKKWVCFFAIATLGMSTSGGETPPAGSPAQTDGADESTVTEYASPSLIPIQDTPGLPRVLLIGDSISMGYTIPTRKALEGKANVHRPPTNCGSTLSGLRNLNSWIGSGKWDVIHFNWGMHDLKYLGSGRQNVPIERYEKNLDELVDRLKKTGAVLIFATTTPLVRETQGRFRRDAQAELLYNETARKVMEERGVRVNDLHAFALPKIEIIQAADGVHFTKDGSNVLARQVVASITEALREMGMSEGGSK